ncbi:acyl-CoA-binding domain-containing protein 6 isoform X2 [Ascaphus truei]|uniref:acyl-CoA-binding domain-containing protein 6 isoform X2 n=1 Tax=Ascaphus truei TaxID=8439 RepID=UPI003F59F82F
MGRVDKGQCGDHQQASEAGSTQGAAACQPSGIQGQVKVGKCNTPKPGFFDFEGKQKWEAWKALGDYSPQQAMQEYIATVRKVDPAWSPKAAEGANEQRKTTFGGPVVSCLFQEQETIREEDKNIFDYCRENNIARVSQAVCSGTVDVNATDEEGRGLLHWACDRGHSQLVSVLLQHNSHVNIQNHYSFITLISVHPAQAISVRQQGGKNYFLAPNKRRQDSEGQTPLHYASACEFLDIVQLLLAAGADTSLVDQDGCQPHEATDCREISAILQQHAKNREHGKPMGLLIENPQ